MKCSEAQSLITPYLNEQLSDEKLHAFLEHMRGCASCREDLELYMAVYSVLDDEDSETYNFAAAMDEKLAVSRQDLEKRSARTAMHRVMVFAAEIVLMMALVVAMGRRIQQQSAGTSSNVPVKLDTEIDTEAYTEKYADTEAASERAGIIVTGET